MSETIPFTSRDSKLPPWKACEEEPGHDRRDRGENIRSGIWVCSLQTLTPLCIQAAFASQQKQGNQALVPGSSLRGMLRNVCEMLGAGCARYYEGRASADHLRTCSPGKACLVCRVFGFVEGDFAWAGKVRVSDTTRVAVQWKGYHLPRQRPPHSEGNGAGWMIFPACKASVAEGGRTWCVDAGRSFPFLLEYLNLEADEYAILKFALTLNYKKLDLVHCLGYGKSLGLGACKILIQKDTSPPIGPEIEPYLEQPGFPFFEKLRDRSRLK